MKPIIIKILRTKATIYNTSISFLLKPISTKPHIKKATLNTLAPKPVNAAQFG